MADKITKILGPGDRRILFVGIGNLLRQDDGAGVYISTRIRETERVKVITAEAGIENYIGKINNTEHDLLVLIDCADMQRPPGAWDLIAPEQVRDLTFSTHDISLKKLSGFFKKEVQVLAIQPETVAFGENLSYIVLEACRHIIDLINKKEVQNGR